MLSRRVFIRFKSYNAQNFRNWLYFVNLLKHLKSYGLNKPQSTKSILVYFTFSFENLLLNFAFQTMEKSKFLHFWKVQRNPEKSRVLALKSDKNSQSYNEITKIDDFSQKTFFSRKFQIFSEKNFFWCLRLKFNLCYLSEFLSVLSLIGLKTSEIGYILWIC